jgi:radical SAM superfamily enzyme YgiQ (UPF0313 family)
MRIVFVDNLLFEDAEGINRYVLQPHLGLISLIAMLEQEGHTGVLVDPKIPVAQGLWPLDGNLYQRIAENILGHEPDVVGMTSLGCNFICTVKVAGHLKRNRPELPIILGGPHATVLDRTVLSRFSQFDAIARNEAECTIVPLVEEIRSRNLWKIPGITFRTGTTIWQNPSGPIIENLDELPIPAYHAYPIPALKLKSIRVDAGRGCPFQCTFCSTATFFGRKYRLKSAARLVEELDFLCKTYGVSDFALSHDLFTVNRHKVKEFCDAVEGRGYTWKCSARMDCVDDELLQTMAAAGCRSIYYGIEAGSQKMQKIAKKQLNLAIFDPTLDRTQELRMSATVSFITGYPEESRDDQIATLDLMASCFVPRRRRSPLNVQLHLLTPEPGTELLNQYQESILYDGHVSDFNFPNLESDDGMIIESNPTVFINHHYFPSALPRNRHIFVSEIYQFLYSLGYPLLHYIIRCVGGTFGEFIESMYEWYLQDGANRHIDGSLIEPFLAAKLGESHHLCGLVRYMLHAADLRKRTYKYATPAAPQSQMGSVYQLGAYSRLVLDVPDCPQVLNHLLNTPTKKLPSKISRERYSFLLHMQQDDSSIVKNYLLTDPAAAVLGWFTKPCSVSRFKREFPQATGYPLPPNGFLKQLIAQEFLEESRSEHSEAY